MSCPELPERPSSTLYSTVHSNGLFVDGACYSFDDFVRELTAEGELAIVTNGSQIDSCGELFCGDVGLYCYESVDAPTTYILTSQPLNFPPPVVALEENIARCYQNPSFIEELNGTIIGTAAQVVSLPHCGVAYQYTEHDGVDQIVVIFGTGSYSSLEYDNRCWEDPAVVTTAGTLPILGQDDVVESTGCARLDVTGPSVLYAEVFTGQQVNVQFDHLDLGIPYYGVSPDVVDDGDDGLVAGEIRLTFNNPVKTVIQSVSGTGLLEISTDLTGTAKTFRLYRNGAEVDSISLRTMERRARLSVEPGDRIEVDISNRQGRLTVLTKNLTALFRYYPVVQLPRLYYTGTLSGSGSSSIQAVAFAGLSNRTDASVYTSFPADTSQSYPNPESIVTVQGATGGEVALVRCRAIGDIAPRLPVAVDSFYAGENLDLPLIFRFYAGREAVGMHGEMDVWLEFDGTFPQYLKIDDARAFEIVGDGTRRTGDLDDISRNSLRVTDNLVGIDQINVYVNSEGRRIYAASSATVLIVDGTEYTSIGAATGIPGELTVVDGVNVLIGDALLANEDSQVLASDTEGFVLSPD